MSSVNPLLVLSDSKNFISHSYMEGAFLHINSGLIIVPKTNLISFSDNTKYKEEAKLISVSSNSVSISISLNKSELKEYIEKSF